MRVHTATQAGLDTARARPDPTEILDIARSWGAEAVMLSAHQIPSLDEASLRRIRLHAERLGMGVELSIRTRDLDALEAWIERAESIGAGVLRLTVGNFGDGERWKLQEPAAVVLDRAARLLAASKSAASRSDVRIAIENHMDFTLSEYASLLERLDPEWFGVCLDTGNPLGTIEDPWQVAQALAPRVITTHVKDYLPIWWPGGLRLVTVPLGEGVVPIHRIVQHLRGLGRVRAYNLELPVYSVRVIPIHRPGFWEAYGERSASDLARVVELIREAHPEQIAKFAPPNGLEARRPVQDLLAEEARYFVESLRHLQAMRRGMEDEREIGA